MARSFGKRPSEHAIRGAKLRDSSVLVKGISAAGWAVPPAKDASCADVPTPIEFELRPNRALGHVRHRLELRPLLPPIRGITGSRSERDYARSRGRGRWG